MKQNTSSILSDLLEVHLRHLEETVRPGWWYFSLVAQWTVRLGKAAPREKYLTQDSLFVERIVPDIRCDKAN